MKKIALLFAAALLLSPLFARPQKKSSKNEKAFNDIPLR